jgi:site-specific DNA recombinase
MCSGAREWWCWNSIGFPGDLAARRITEAITTRLDQLDDFSDQFAEILSRASQDVSGGLSERWAKVLHAEKQLLTEKDNLMAAITAYGPRPMLHDKLAKLEASEKELAQERYRLEHLQGQRIRVPESPKHLRSVLAEGFHRQALDSPEFGDLLRQPVPEFHVFLVRMCDGGHLLPRARVKLSLAGSFEDIDRVPELRDLLSQVVTLDLFDEPPQRERIRVEAVRLAASGMTYQQIANRLPDHPTSTAVGNSLALERMMRGLGITSPYVILDSPPDDYSKLRRHKNKKYRFEPLEGYPRPPLV